MMERSELFVSVDVETSGPIPGEYSLLAIGACLIDRPEVTFSCYVQPINGNFDPAALRVTGLSLETLDESGDPPTKAIANFTKWLEEVRAPEDRLVFVGLNAPFDWSFVNYYFHKFGSGNPFGFSALDIKAYYMGATGVRWDATTSTAIATRFNVQATGDHNPLHDALFQAALFRSVRDHRRPD